MNSCYEKFVTKQQCPHEQLIKIVTKYKTSNYRRPIPSHQIDAFKEILAFARKFNGPLILDSGCGTGLSTLNLAERYKDHGVVGIDKSTKRLERSPDSSQQNYLLVRGDLIDLWRLLANEGIKFARHYLLYPCPWPKISHVGRRFHAHPIFKAMLALSTYFELRTNWRIYAEEAAIALKLFDQSPAIFLNTDKTPISLFEKKYLATNCPIYVVTNELKS